MKYRRLLLAAFSILLLTSFAGATDTGETTIEPLNETVIDSNSSINNSNVTKNTLPFDLEVSNDSISVNASLDFPPQIYTGEVVLKNNYSHNYKLNLQRYTNWTLSRDRIESDINVGTSGSFSNQSIQLEGNTNTTVSTNISGNVSQYLDVTDQVTVFPGINSRIILSYQVPQNTDYGNYTGILNLTGEHGSYQEIPLRFQFRDNITPTVESVDTPSFDASFPKKFTVEASDNIGVETVEAEIVETVTKNGTEKNTTVSGLSFSHKQKTDRWTATPSEQSNGTYYVVGEVVDEAGNKANFTSKYTVRPLDAVTVDDSLQLNNYRVETEITEKFGEINRSTMMNVRLKSFNQPLQSPNETWTLAVKTDTGKQFLREENSTVTVHGPTDLELFVYSNSNERFNGELSFEPVKEHVPVNDFSFYGSYLDCPVPKKKTETVFNKTILFTPAGSDNCGEAAVNVTYQILMKNIDSMDEIGESMGIYVPRQVEQEINENYKQRIENKDERIESLKSDIGGYKNWDKAQNIIIGLLLVALYWVKNEEGSFFYAKLRDSKPKRERIKEDLPTKSENKDGEGFLQKLLNR